MFLEFATNGQWYLYPLTTLCFRFTGGDKIIAFVINGSDDGMHVETIRTGNDQFTSNVAEIWQHIKSCYLEVKS